MEEIIGYLKSNLEQYVAELKEYLRIPSISTLETHKGKMVDCAEFVAGKLKQQG
jgi:acetylornithine deacetylase/succinyl-diaminopimelate desuccinylase-like protein